MTYYSVADTSVADEGTSATAVSFFGVAAFEIHPLFSSASPFQLPYSFSSAIISDEVIAIASSYQLLASAASILSVCHALQSFSSNHPPFLSVFSHGLLLIFSLNPMLSVHFFFSSIPILIAFFSVSLMPIVLFAPVTQDQPQPPFVSVTTTTF